MSGVRINCPKCGRILGDTNHDIDAVLNCNGCKQRVRVQMKIVRFEDYFDELKQEAKDNDKQ